MSRESGGAFADAAATARPEPAATWDGRIAWREYALLALSLLCMVWLLPARNCLLLAALAAAVYLIGSLRATRTRKRVLVVLALLAFVALNQQARRQGLPYVIWGGVGLEIFLVLRCVDWAVSKAPRGLSIRTADRVGQFLLYLFFLPTLFAGPAPTCADFYRSYRPHEDSLARRVIDNTPRILWGAVRYFLIHHYVREAARHLKTGADSGLSLYFLDPWLLLWGYVVLVLVFTYVQFSGFVDMGIGLSRILGFQLYENFDKPLLSTSPLRYWKSFNISVYRFLMAHVFYPFWGHSQITRKIMTTFLVSGLWHIAVARIISPDAAIQLLLAVSIYGTAVVATVKFGATRAGVALDGLRRTRAGPVIWSVQWLLTLTFTALVHQLFLAGMSGQPLHNNVELFHRLFLPGAAGVS